MNKKLRGVGINLRLELIDSILERLPEIPFLEVIADNWLSKGPHHQKLEKLREHYDISFHCVGMNLGGVDDINYDYLNEINQLKKKFEPFQISDHLSYQAHKYSYHHDLLPIPLNQKYLKNTSERIRKAQDVFNEKILLENPTYYLEFEESNIEEAEFLNSVAKDADCRLLLDLNNIWVNSKNFDVNLSKYLDTINWERVGEVHLAGPDQLNDLYIDTHGSNINNELFKVIDQKKRTIE